MSRRPIKPPSKESFRPTPSVSRSQTSKPSLTSAKSSASQKASLVSKPTKPSTTSTKEVKAWDLPALSLTYKPKVTESELEKLKKKTIRRNAPPGEDLKQIRNILKSIKGQDISVNEFISLIAPSTGDRGETLRKIMNDDLASFRKLAKKVYETITKDNSDVLLNQQLQLAEYYKERKNIYHHKMMKYIEEIYLMAPNFDFERFSKDREKYLEEILPIPEELKVEPEELEMLKRQAAYHRLQWLRSEGERLNEENNSLKKRLNQLKRAHKEEQARMLQIEHEAETKKEALEATHAQKIQELEILNESLEKSLIDKEREMRIDKDKVLLEPVPSKKHLKTKKSKGAVRRKRPPWNEVAAQKMEEQAAEKSEVAEVRRATSPFHFSPIKTPPQRTAPPKERSPFHYSPPRYEETRYASPTPPPQQSASRPQARPQTPPRQGYGRRVQGPRDTWGGFY